MTTVKIDTGGVLTGSDSDSIGRAGVLASAHLHLDAETAFHRHFGWSESRSYEFTATHVISAGGASLVTIPRAVDSLASHRHSLHRLQQLAAIQVGQSAISVNFGTLPVAVEPQAASYLANLPWRALAAVLGAIRLWAETAPARRARAVLATDPEDETWQEVVVEIRIDAGDEAAYALWDELANEIDAAKSALSDDQRRLLARAISVQLVW